jgi:transposase
MPNPRISVSQLKQLIQLRANQLSTRAIAAALSLSQGAVSKYGRAVLASCQTWEAALGLEETELERRVFAQRRLRPAPTTKAPDSAWIHTEMKRHKHVTLQLLWEEYHASHGRAALRYSAFCERYRQWAKRL